MIFSMLYYSGSWIFWLFGYKTREQRLEIQMQILRQELEFMKAEKGWVVLEQEEEQSGSREGSRGSGSDLQTDLG